MKLLFETPGLSHECRIVTDHVKLTTGSAALVGLKRLASGGNLEKVIDSDPVPQKLRIMQIMDEATQS